MSENEKITKIEAIPVGDVIELAPRAPGCYLMRDADGKVLYIGKSKELKNRMRQYFGETLADDRILIALMLPKVATVEFILTASEKEALVLENNLIKRRKPAYNVRIRDDKTYFSLMLDCTHPFPRLYVIRRRSKTPVGKNKPLFGPYTSAKAARYTLALVNKYFSLRTCADRDFATRKRPCIRFQMRRCYGPCVEEVEESVYNAEIRRVKLFLEGKADLLAPELEAQMLQASEKLDFEEAARLRDLIKSVEQTVERQRVELPTDENVDSIAIYREGESGAGVVLPMRNGMLGEGESYKFEGIAESDAEIVSRLIMAHYEENAPPETILTTVELPDADAISALLSEKRGGKTELKCPQKGRYKEIVLNALRNARQRYEANRAKLDPSVAALAKIAKILRTTQPLRHVECYDISNTQGSQPVGSKVCFIDGAPAKALYRRYRIKTVEGQDDFSMLKEVLTRRITRGMAENDLPDLIVIDGGKGQLAQANAVLRELRPPKRIYFISIAKERARYDGDEPRFASPDIERNPERLFFPETKNPLVLKDGTAEKFFFTRIRDEAHRFAIEFHRDLRGKKAFASELDLIPLIGEERKNALLKAFGSLKRVKEATLEQLMAVGKMTEPAARNVYDAFHEEAEEEEE